MRRVEKWFLMLLVLIIICYFIIVWLSDPTEEYGPPLPTDTDRIAALEKALEGYEAALQKHENDFHFYWKLDKTK